jgi:tetratricopeptide (TPR) repeat protein
MPSTHLRLTRFVLALLLISVSATSQDANRDLARAEKLYKAGKYAVALEAFQAVLDADPDRAPAYSGAGKCLIGLNRVSDAVKLMMKAVKRPGADAENHAVLGQAMYWDANGILNTPDSPRADYASLVLADAESNLARAVEMDPKLHVASYYLGKVRMMLDRPGDAGPAFMQAAKLAPRKYKDWILGAYCDAAQCFDRAGDKAKTLAAFKAGFKFDPQSTKLFTAIWAMYGARKPRQDEGVAVLKALVQTRKSAALPHYYLGYLYKTMGKKVEARKAFERLLKTAEGKKFASAWARLAEIVFEQDKDEKKAEKYMLKALKLDPNDAGAAKYLQFLAARAKERGEISRYLDINRAILKYQPKNGQVWNNLANHYHNSRQLNEALKYYAKGLEYAPNDEDIKCGAAMVYNDLNRDQEAEKLWKAALKINPKHVLSLMNYGWFCKRRGRRQEAIQLFSRVLEVDPHHARARRELDSLQ